MNSSYKYIVGIDEVGRGPLAGPVVVGAFCVASEDVKAVLLSLDGITDSKKLTAKKREIYAEKIKELQKQDLVQVAISGVSAKVIDEQGIVPAINSALVSSLKKIDVNPEEVFIYLDGGLYAPQQYLYQETVVKGDSKIWQIGAASVIAKVMRDKKMIEFGKKNPEYGFENHKGYGTQRHRDAIRKHGVIDIHRKTWIKI
ncbi:MAG: ribonuclease HII [Crocinitomicaceae bacterium]|jgi:ribonuclease HII